MVDVAGDFQYTGVVHLWQLQVEQDDGRISFSPISKRIAAKQILHRLGTVPNDDDLFAIWLRSSATNIGSRPWLLSSTSKMG